MRTKSWAVPAGALGDAAGASARARDGVREAQAPVAATAAAPTVFRNRRREDTAYSSFPFEGALPSAQRGTKGELGSRNAEDAERFRSFSIPNPEFRIPN
jgi:hypothetical protein